MFNDKLRPWVYAVLLATGSVLLFLGGPDYYSSRSYKHCWDIGHIIYFALFAGLFARWRFIAAMSVAGQWATTLLVSLLLGACIELAQYDTARTPDIADVLRDLTGSLVALSFGPPGLRLQPVRLRRALQVSVFMLLVIQLVPIARSLIDEAIARRQYPVLSDFETAFEVDRWVGSAGRSIQAMPSISPGNLLKLSLGTDRYSGAELKYFDGDWSSFRTLDFRLYNPDEEPLKITCRIHDLRHLDGKEEYEDRFNRRYLLRKGWNDIEVDLEEVKESPAGRRMDMSNIRGLGLFVTSLPAPRVVYLDNVRLSP